MTYSFCFLKFFSDIFDLWLVEFMNEECVDTWMRNVRTNCNPLCRGSPLSGFWEPLEKKEFLIFNISVWPLIFSKGICCWFCSVSHLCPTLCDPMDCSIPGLPVPHRLLKFAPVHVRCIGDAIQLSHSLRPSSLSDLSLSQHQGLLKLSQNQQIFAQ